MVLARALGALVMLLAALASATAAEDAALREIIAKFAASRNYSATAEIVGELAATGDPRVGSALNALSDGDLAVRKSDDQVFVVRERGQTAQLADPLTGEADGEEPKAAMAKVRVNNSLRRSVRDAIVMLTLGSEDPAVRMSAAHVMYRNPDAANVEALKSAISDEQVASVKTALEDALASATLVSDLWSLGRGDTQ